MSSSIETTATPAPAPAPAVPPVPPVPRAEEYIRNAPASFFDGTCSYLAVASPLGTHLDVHVTPQVSRNAHPDTAALRRPSCFRVFLRNMDTSVVLKKVKLVCVSDFIHPRATLVYDDEAVYFVRPEDWKSVYADGDRSDRVFNVIRVVGINFRELSSPTRLAGMSTVVVEGAHSLCTKLSLVDGDGLHAVVTEIAKNEKGLRWADTYSSTAEKPTQHRVSLAGAYNRRITFTVLTVPESSRGAAPGTVSLAVRGPPQIADLGIVDDLFKTQIVGENLPLDVAVFPGQFPNSYFLAWVDFSGVVALRTLRGFEMQSTILPNDGETFTAAVTNYDTLLLLSRSENGKTSSITELSVGLAKKKLKTRRRVVFSTKPSDPSIVAIFPTVRGSGAVASDGQYFQINVSQRTSNYYLNPISLVEKM